MSRDVLEGLHGLIAAAEHEMVTGILEATPGELAELQAIRTRLDQALTALKDGSEVEITLLKDLLIVLIMMQGWVIAGVVPVTDEQRAGVPQWRRRLIELIAEAEDVDVDRFRETLSGKMVRVLSELRREPGPRGFLGMRSLIEAALADLRH